MAGPVLQVDGARQLRRALRDAGMSVQDLKDAHRAVAELVQDRARPDAPRRTGALDRSTRAAGTQSAAIVRAGGARLRYAAPIHWGWPARNIAAQPWIHDAAQDTQDTWVGMYADALQQIIDRIEGTPGP